MVTIRLLLAGFLTIPWWPSAAWGIYISTEKLDPNPELKSFTDQLRFLRAYGPTDISLGGKATKQREDFLAKVAALKAKPSLSSDEQADLGGYLLYLKQSTPRALIFEEAVAVLEAGYRTNPRHFRLAANLGTAYQLTGRLDAAQRCLEAAVDLAPADQKPVQRLQLRLVQLRLRESLGRGQLPDLDGLFGRPTQPFRFVDEKGAWSYGQLAAREVEKLPGQSVEQAVHLVQQLLVRLPDDGRLLWQFGEWCLVLGKKHLALELFNNAVDTFRLSHPSLKQHRHLLQEALLWGTFAERLGGGKAEPWIARALGQGMVQLLAIDGLAGPLVALADVGSVRPESPFGGNLFDQLDSEPAGKPFVLQPWHWALIGLGIVLALLMLIWQVQQFFRPRRAVAS
jgi:tetratricopeptide (TPR) repeat protein